MGKRVEAARQIEQGREFKKDLGSSPNGVSNSWLKQRGGQFVTVWGDRKLIAEGTLLAFDLFTLELAVENSGKLESWLVFKGPGIVVRGALQPNV